MLRVGTANLLHGMSLRDARADPDVLRAAARLLDADVLGLQEVDRAQPRSGGVDQTDVVAATLGAVEHAFVATLTGTPGPTRTWTAVADDAPQPAGPAYGVALVSRLPVRSWHVLRFPPAKVGAPLLVPAAPRPRVAHVPDEPRAAVAAVVDLAAGGVATVATAHLSFVPGTNLRQLRRVVRWLAGLPAPRVLAADLNLPGALPRLVSGWPALARAATYPAPRPRVQLDHVLGSGVDVGQVRRAAAVELPVSDHRALLVDLDLPGRPAGGLRG